MKEKISKTEADLYAALALLATGEEIRRFMADLCTPGESKAFAERWAIAQLLDKDALGYREISAETGASTTTVARVARFLKQERYQGYRLILDRMAADKAS
jgi:TrpR-related protein YerC/YecD